MSADLRNKIRNLAEQCVREGVSFNNVRDSVERAINDVRGFQDRDPDINEMSDRDLRTSLTGGA